MASFDYPATAALASRLLAQFGVMMDVKIREEATYDPVSGTTTYGYLNQEFRTSVRVYGVLDDYSETEVDGTTIQIGDMKIYLDPALPANPKAGDVIQVPLMLENAVIGYEEYEVVSSTPVRPGAQVVLHQVQVRRD